MKMHQIIATLILSMIPLWAYAGWQVSSPETLVPREPFFEVGKQQKVAVKAVPSAYASTVFPNQYAKLGQPVPVYAVSVSGSVKDNLERIMNRYHWRVIWKAPFDYNFDGRITGSNLANVVQKLLDPFPLQAVMYMSNRTITVVPRPKK